MRKIVEVRFKVLIECEETRCGKCHFVAGTAVGHPHCEILNQSPDVGNSSLTPIDKTFLRLPECLNAEVKQ
jgi:hypothetical protein